MKDKKTLRKEMLKKREILTQQEIDSISKTIFDKVKQLQCFRDAQTIMVYVSYQKELNTFDFIKDCISLGKRVATPVCNKDHTMTLALTKDFPEDHKQTPMGILEIPRENITEVFPDELDIIISPGLAFTLDGERIGYGGGFYDRLYAVIPEKTKLIAPSFDMCVVDEIPTDEYDKKIDILLTEKRSVFIPRK